jgi:glycosyltransferase involved in cell wall biosynthesis
MMPLFYVFSICILLQTFFAIWMLWAGGSAKDAARVAEGNAEPLSIIICAHNEAANLAQNLPILLQQSAANYEVIVVNDASEDDSDNILQALSAQYSHLGVVKIGKEEERLLPGKKFALSKGIAAAKNENLLLCDADCMPASERWASLMNNALVGQKEIVAGYGAYAPRKGWLNVFVRWETLHTFLQYSSYAKTGLPYMAVGRNLACKKSVLLQAQADPLWAAMPSGDDDLLIRLMGNKKNVAIVANPSAFTISEAKTSFGEWVHQKQRHVSTGKIYKKHIQLLLGAYGASHGLMWLLWLMLWIGGMGYLISSLMILRCMLVWSLWAIHAENLKEKKLILWLPLCDIGWGIYHLILSPYIFYKTKKQWK